MLSLKVNGALRQFEVAADTPLLWVLRDHAGLTGTKFGCGIAVCGACTVHVDGQPVRACVTTVGSVAGKDIRTIEGIDDPVSQIVRQAWIEEEVPQCGYCQSGQIMAAVALLRRKPQPDDDDINQVMSGHLCRCGTYQRVRKAVYRAAKALEVFHHD